MKWAQFGEGEPGEAFMYSRWRGYMTFTRATTQVRCTYTAVSHFPVKGGGAYAERALEEIPAFPAVLLHCPSDNDVHSPKCVLTARAAPE